MARKLSKALMTTVVVLLFNCQLRAHNIAVHESLADHAMKDANSVWGDSWLDPVCGSEIAQGSIDEDNELRACNHAYNPIQGTAGFQGFIFGGVCTSDVNTAKQQAIDLWGKMLEPGRPLTGGDGIGKYHYLGRCCHLVQDMSAFPHVHHEDIWEAEHIEFEETEETLFSEHGWLVDSPLLPTDNPAVVTDILAMLDDFSIERLLSKSFSSNEVSDFVEHVARITYFRSTFWGEVVFGTGDNGEAAPESTSETTFRDGHADAKPNTLRIMFGAANVRYISTWIDDYFQINDIKNNSLTWEDNWDEEWHPCAGDKIDGSKTSDSNPVGVNVRTTGRFIFKEPYYPVVPPKYPNGDTFDVPSLGYYMSYYSMKAGLRYNAGLIGVGSATLGCGLTGTLTIQSQNPDSGVSIMVSPADEDGSGDGDTPFTRTYKYGTVVTLTAPAVVSANTFSKWLKNGSDCDTNREITVAVKSNDSLTAVYDMPDLNTDWSVNFEDFCILANRWRDMCFGPSWCDGADFDESGEVDHSDLAILTENWLRTAAEPTEDIVLVPAGEFLMGDRINDCKPPGNQDE